MLWHGSAYAPGRHCWPRAVCARYRLCMIIAVYSLYLWRIDNISDIFYMANLVSWMRTSGGRERGSAFPASPRTMTAWERLPPARADAPTAGVCPKDFLTQRTYTGCTWESHGQGYWLALVTGQGDEVSLSTGKKLAKFFVTRDRGGNDSAYILDPRRKFPMRLHRHLQ